MGREKRVQENIIAGTDKSNSNQRADLKMLKSGHLIEMVEQKASPQIDKLGGAEC